MIQVIASVVFSCIGTVFTVIITSWYKHWKDTINNYLNSLIEHEWIIKQNIYLLNLVKSNMTTIYAILPSISYGKPYTIAEMDMLDDGFRTQLLQYYNMLLKLKITPSTTSTSEALQISKFTLRSIKGERKFVTEYLARFPLLFWVLPILLRYIRKRFFKEDTLQEKR